VIFYVTSAANPAVEYRVVYNPITRRWHCSCLHWVNRCSLSGESCKHILAAQEQHPAAFVIDQPEEKTQGRTMLDALEGRGPREIDGNAAERMLRNSEARLRVAEAARVARRHQLKKRLDAGYKKLRRSRPCKLEGSIRPGGKMNFSEEL